MLMNTKNEKYFLKDPRFLLLCSSNYIVVSLCSNKGAFTNVQTTPVKPINNYKLVNF